jgi:hypothetical protein
VLFGNWPRQPVGSRDPNRALHSPSWIAAEVGIVQAAGGVVHVADVAGLGSKRSVVVAERVVADRVVAERVVVERVVAERVVAERVVVERVVAGAELVLAAVAERDVILCLLLAVSFLETPPAMQ